MVGRKEKRKYDNGRWETKYMSTLANHEISFGFESHFAIGFCFVAKLWDFRFNFI